MRSLPLGNFFCLFFIGTCRGIHVHSSSSYTRKKKKHIQQARCPDNALIVKIVNAVVQLTIETRLSRWWLGHTEFYVRYIFFNDELHECIFGSVVLNSSAHTLSSTPVTVNQARFCREEKESVYVKSFRVDSSLGFLSGRYDMQFVHSIWSLTAFREVKLLPWRRLQAPFCACPRQMDNYVWFWHWLSFANWHQRDRDEWWEIFLLVRR